MTQDTRIIDLIERASAARPFCPCGSHTTPVWRDGVVWLECATISDPDGSQLRRILNSIAGPWHVHLAIVEAPAVGAEERAAA